MTELVGNVAALSRANRDLSAAFAPATTPLSSRGAVSGPKASPPSRKRGKETFASVAAGAAQSAKKTNKSSVKRTTSAQSTASAKKQAAGSTGKPEAFPKGKTVVERVLNKVRRSCASPKRSALIAVVGLTNDQVLERIQQLGESGQLERGEPSVPPLLRYEIVTEAMLDNTDWSSEVERVEDLKSLVALAKGHYVGLRGRSASAGVIVFDDAQNTQPNPVDPDRLLSIEEAFTPVLTGANWYLKFHQVLLSSAAVRSSVSRALNLASTDQVVLPPQEGPTMHVMTHPYRGEGFDTQGVLKVHVRHLTASQTGRKLHFYVQFIRSDGCVRVLAYTDLNKWDGK